MSETYYPCFTGLHICGKSIDELEPVTVANYSMRRKSAARTAFDKVKRELGNLPAEDADLVVDLQERGDCAHTCGIRRQDLARVTTITREVDEMASREKW